jgi:hypothetical protein
VKPPSRQEIKQALDGLLTEETTREEVADWAAQLQTAPGEYLHHDSDFHAWLDDLENAGAER